MKYLSEINAFEFWLETHHLPTSAQLLWYKLMCIANKAGWCEWMSVDNLRLMAIMQMNREATLINTRNELIKAGLIEYRRGKKGSPGKYKMVSVYKLAFKSEVESEVKEVVETEEETEDIIRNRNRTRIITPRPPVGAEQQKSNLDQYNSFMKSEFDFDDLEKRLTGN